MIKFADNTTKQQVWDMWKTVFGDADSYMELYFRTKYKNENTLLYFEGNKAVASLQMLQFNFTFCDTEIPIYYLSGVSTLPDARKKGYMQQLLIESYKVCYDRGIPMMLLVPQEEWLLNFYGKYGFAQTFDTGKETLIDIKELLESHSNDILAAYKEFDALFRNQDMTVQKTYDDFKAIVDEATLWDYPEKKSLIGMARIIDANMLLNIFADKYPKVNLQIDIIDDLIPANNTTYHINKGIVSTHVNNSLPIINVDIRQLAQLLLGYNTYINDKDLSLTFPKKSPQMHFMME